MGASGSSFPQGIWSDDETLLIIVLIKLLYRLEMDDVAIYDLYQKYFTYNDTSQDGFKLLLRTKSIKQVDGKLKYIRTNEKFG